MLAAREQRQSQTVHHALTDFLDFVHVPRVGRPFFGDRLGNGFLHVAREISLKAEFVVCLEVAVSVAKITTGKSAVSEQLL